MSALSRILGLRGVVSACGGACCGIGLVARLPFLKFRPDARAKAQDTSKIAAKNDSILLLASNFPPVLGGSAVVPGRGIAGYRGPRHGGGREAGV